MVGSSDWFRVYGFLQNSVIGGLVPIGIDGIGQLFGFWESTNIMRVTTGLIIGVCCGISIGIIIDEIKTFIPFKKTKSN